MSRLVMTFKVVQFWQEPIRAKPQLIPPHCIIDTGQPHSQGPNTDDPRAGKNNSGTASRSYLNSLGDGWQNLMALGKAIRIGKKS